MTAFDRAFVRCDRTSCRRPRQKMYLRYWFPHAYDIQISLLSRASGDRKKSPVDAGGPRRILNFHPGGCPKFPNEFIRGSVYARHARNRARIRRRFIVISVN